MSLARKKILFTYQDLEFFEPDNYRHEISEGEHFMTPSPSTYHQKIVGNLYRKLSDYVEKNKLGEIYVSPVDVIFHEIDVFVPDLVFVSNENLSIVSENNIQGAPDLIIEVMSPSSVARDREGKYKRYAYYGVKEYWIVDLQRKLVEVYDLEQDKLINVIPQKQKLNSPIFEDLNLDLTKIF
jgi:Uma2 family endonuclease